MMTLAFSMTQSALAAKRAVTLAACAVAALAFAGFAAADEAKDESNPYLWKPRVTSVAVFKNGMGFFLGEGETRLRDGWCLAGEVPPAAFGTLAFFSHGKDETVDVVGSGPAETVDFDGQDHPADAAAKARRLEEAKSLNVRLTYTRDGRDASAAGKLKAVGADYAILEDDASTFAVPVAAVKRMETLDLPVRIHVAADAGDSPERATLGIGYLRRGITWIPEYTLTIVGEDEAELTLRGTFVNEAEDLIHCDVNFVVGVPHFAHTDYLAPIAVGQMIRTIGAATAPAAIASQLMNRAQIANNYDRRDASIVDRPVDMTGGDVGGAVANLPQLAGAAATDYTVYTRKDLTVRRGEKAIVTLFTKRIKYSHLYRWSPPAAMEHFLVLANSTDTAWTTGPCLIVSGERPLSEDLLKYVPRGGSGEMPVTTAVNVSYNQSETEAERKLKAHEPSREFFLDLVMLEGMLVLVNYEKNPVTVAVSAAIPGRPLSASDDGQLNSDTSELKLQDRRGSIRWDLTVGAGQTKQLKYTYERYVPSR